MSYRDGEHEMYCSILISNRDVVSQFISNRYIMFIEFSCYLKLVSNTISIRPNNCIWVELGRKIELIAHHVFLILLRLDSHFL